MTGSNTFLAHLMRDSIRSNLSHGTNGHFSQMLQGATNHAGLQAAFYQQITDSLTVWQNGINQLFVTCPFLTKLDLSRYDCEPVSYSLCTLQG